MNASFLQRLNHITWVAIPGFVQHGLTQNEKMDNKIGFYKILHMMQLLPMYGCKYTSKAEIEYSGLYSYCDMLLVFEDRDAKDKTRNKREIKILTNACFLALIMQRG